ncbi:MAG: hypothetical protein G01um101419_75 [Parcubacteria group bacterium Gr01-1014_19]|nr:MAG: hypothetical protein G01um101419_75 [Parcubacteria group bacterium Gr01-1014_19]
MLSLAQMQEAAKLIEIDGVEAYQTVCRKFGEQVAQLVLVAHLRRSYGSTDSYPPNPSINPAVEVFLRKHGITISDPQPHLTV